MRDWQYYLIMARELAKVVIVCIFFADLVIYIPIIYVLQTVFHTYISFCWWFIHSLIFIICPPLENMKILLFLFYNYLKQFLNFQLISRKLYLSINWSTDAFRIAVASAKHQRRYLGVLYHITKRTTHWYMHLSKMSLLLNNIKKI